MSERDSPRARGAGAPGYDYVVVGGGTAGVVVASRLAEDPSVRVALIEAGPQDRSPLFRVPGAASRVAFDPRNAWGYMTEPQAALDGRRQSLIQARVLGGGSSINGMVYTRGSASDYDRWQQLGAQGWSYADVLPWFRRSQRSDRAGSEWHGSAGPVATRRGRSPLKVASLMLDALGEAGFPILDDLNIPSPDGFGWNDWAIDQGRRASSAAAFAGGRGKLPNLDLLTDMAVSGLLFEGGRVVGVRASSGREVRTVRAERETILAAGAIGTPRLLLLSGIGPAEALHAVGITSVADLPQVGQNLSNHIAYALAYRCSEPISARRYIHPVNGPIEFLRYVAGRRGFLSNGAAPVGGFFRSRADLAEPDMQLFAVPALFGGKGPLPEEHGYTLIINQGRPYSSGTVTLRSSDPAEPPIIDPRYLADQRDMDSLVDGIETIRAVARQPSLAGITTEERTPGSVATSRSDLERSVRALANNYYHVSGTCRMGADARVAVTAPDLTVHGVPGLSIADGSVMPSLVNGNTNAPIMMIAERAAAFAAERNGSTLHAATLSQIQETA